MTGAHAPTGPVSPPRPGDVGSGAGPHRPGTAARCGGRVLLTLIRAYQLARAGRASPCRFTPTCSEYAAQAVHLHGARRGLGLTARRLLRCRPGGPFGYDPVPPASE